MNITPVLRVQNLTKTFISKKIFRKSESFTAVNNISFDLRPGEILGILGRNGAGKTTTIQMLLGLLTPTTGSIFYFGKDFFSNRSSIMQEVSFASAYLKLPGSLTVEENLKIYADIYTIARDQKQNRIDTNIELFGLSKLRNRLTRNLSAGQLTSLMLAKAFLPKPKIVLLDEPTAALDPEIALQVRNFIAHERKNSGVSIIFTSHNMAEVEELCDRVLILKDGAIIASETPAHLAATVKISHVKLLITAGIERLVGYLQEKQYVHKTDGAFITIDIEEHQIADLLTYIVAQHITYSQISIDKPTLEDYFLQILQGKARS